MKNYVVYDRQGIIQKTGHCPTDMLELQAGQNEFVMEGQADEESDLIDVLTKTVLRNTRQLPT